MGLTLPKKNSEKTKTNSFRFALGLFALTLITQLFHGYNLAFYVDSGMVSLYLASVCKIVFVVVDGVNDIIFGALSEKTRSRWGKRLPWLVGGMPFLAVFVLLAYAVNSTTGFSAVGFFIYYLLISIMLENASTVMYINYNALYPVLFKKDSERTKTAGFAHFLELVAMGICYICTPLLYEYLNSYLLIGLIYTVIYLGTMTICITGLKVKGQDDVKLQKTYSLRKTFKDVVKNKPFLVYHLAQSFFKAILGLVVSIYPMYCRYVLEASGVYQAILMAALFGSVIISFPLWNYIIRKIGVRRTWKMCFTILPFALLLLLLPSNWWQGILVLIPIGPFVAGLMLTPDMMSAELIDIDKLKNNISREASFNSIGSLISRFSLILSAVVMAAMSFAFGYESGSNPGPNPELAFRAMCGAFLPIIAIFGAISSYIYIRISKKDSDALRDAKVLNVRTND